MNALIPGQVSINTRPSPSNENALTLGRVLGTSLASISSNCNKTEGSVFNKKSEKVLFVYLKLQ